MKEKGSVPRVIIVAVVLGIILVVIVKVTRIIAVTFIGICFVLVSWYFEIQRLKPLLLGAIVLIGMKYEL